MHSHTANSRIAALLLGLIFPLTPSYGQLNDINFPEPNTGYAVSGTGQVLKSTDAGLHWTLINELAVSLTCVHFTSADTGYAGGTSGFDGTILETTDGGTSWSTLLSVTGDPTFVSYTVTDLFFTCDSVGYFSLYRNEPNSHSIHGSSLRKTTDAGQNWYPTYPTSVDSYLWGRLLAIHFADNDTGFVAGYLEKGLALNPLIFRTTDQGENWNLSYNPHDGEPGLTSIYFPSPDTGYAVGYSGLILKSADGGQSWVELTSGTEEDLYSVYFINNNAGVAVGGSGVILRTVNGGDSWAEQPSGTTSKLTSVRFLDDLVGIAGGGPEIIRTTDGGSQWSQVDLPTPVGVTEWPAAPVPRSIFFQNHPNPFNPTSTIRFDLPQGSYVSLILYDIHGREVTRLSGGYMGPGYHKTTWDGRNSDGREVPSGIYIARLVTPVYAKSIKMLLLK